MLSLYDATPSATTLAYLRDVLAEDPLAEPGSEELAAKLRRRGVWADSSEVELVLETLRSDEGEVVA